MLLTLLAGVAGLAAGLASGPGPVVPGASAKTGEGAGDGPTIVATTSIWADLVDQLDCDDTFEVLTLIPAGGDPHAFEPSLQDRDRLDDPALVVANGAGLEGALADTIDEAADDGLVVLTVTDQVDTDDGDPHVWLDPILVSEAIPALAEALEAAGADPAATSRCADALITSLTDLDTEIADLVDTIPAERRLLVTNHDALGYFARRYGFEILGTVLPSTSTMVEASPRQLDDLAAAIDETGVPAIFAEALTSTDDATALADRLDVDVVTLYTDSLGEPDSAAATYQAMMRHDAGAIVGALG